MSTVLLTGNYHTIFSRLFFVQSVYSSADHRLSLFVQLSTVLLIRRSVKPHFHVSLCPVSRVYALLQIRLSSHIFTSLFVQSAVCVYSYADLQHDPRTFWCLGVAVENAGQFRVPAPPHRALVGAGLSTVNRSVNMVLNVLRKHKAY